MTGKAILKIELTREQQLTVLAATGLQVRVLEVDVEEVEDSEAPAARIPIPEWLTKAVAGRQERCHDGH